jgi:hypothetical protein
MSCVILTFMVATTRNTRIMQVALPDKSVECGLRYSHYLRSGTQFFLLLPDFFLALLLLLLSLKI